VGGQHRSAEAAGRGAAAGGDRHTWFTICFLSGFVAIATTMLVKAAWEVTVHYTQSPLPAQPALERQTNSRSQ
jgi:hypothetical protein